MDSPRQYHQRIELCEIVIQSGPLRVAERGHSTHILVPLVEQEDSAARAPVIASTELLRFSNGGGGMCVYEVSFYTYLYKSRDDGGVVVR